MADGIEDLKEKNKDGMKPVPGDYGKWKNLQGREDAEMLLEKTSGWSAENDSRGDEYGDE